MLRKNFNVFPFCNSLADFRIKLIHRIATACLHVIALIPLKTWNEKRVIILLNYNCSMVTHEAGLSASVHKGMTAFSNPSAQLGRRLRIGRAIPKI